MWVQVRQHRICSLCCRRWSRANWQHRFASRFLSYCPDGPQMSIQLMIQHDTPARQNPACPIGALSVSLQRLVLSFKPELKEDIARLQISIAEVVMLMSDTMVPCTDIHRGHTRRSVASSNILAHVSFSSRHRSAWQHSFS